MGFDFLMVPSTKSGRIRAIGIDLGTTNPAVRKRFKGKNFASSSASSLDMAFSGLDDWTLVDVKYKNEKQLLLWPIRKAEELLKAVKAKIAERNPQFGLG